MVYELRKWYEDSECLYTDDQRVKDLAIRSPELRVVGTYFRSGRDVRPFAWDIVGHRSALENIAQTFTAGTRRGAPK